MKLIQATEQDLQEITRSYRDVIACNMPAHRLYESHGFQKRDQRQGHADNVGWTDFFLYEFLVRHRRT